MNGKRQSRAAVWCVLLIGVIVLAPLLGGCAPKPRVYRVGILSGLDFFAAATDGFKAGMTELGYVEGQNIVYDVQEVDFDVALYKSAIQRFVADKVDLIFVFPTEAAVEAKAGTQGTDIPVVFALSMLEGSDLVDSVREPGGNITGVRFPGPAIALRRFEILHELAPQAQVMWVPYQQGYPGMEEELQALRPAATEAGVTLIEFPASSAAELDAELQARLQSGGVGFDAILIPAEPLDVTPDAFLVLARFATEHQILIGGAYMEMEGYETLHGVIVDPARSGELAAGLAAKILRGTPAGTIPVLSPELFVQINYGQAQELGLTVPQSLLAQADQIIP